MNIVHDFIRSRFCKHLLCEDPSQVDFRSPCILKHCQALSSDKFRPIKYNRVAPSSGRRSLDNSRLEGGGEPIVRILRAVPTSRSKDTFAGRCGMKMCPAWSAVRKTSNINIDGPAAPTFVATTDYHTTYV